MPRLLCALSAALLVLLSLSLSPAPVHAKPDPFNQTLAVQMLHMSGAAYCSGESVMQWSCSFCKEEDVATFQPFGVAYNRSTDMLAYVGYEPFSDSVMIAFRGTAILSILDWLSDLNFFQTSAICEGCEVHEGFLAAYLSIRDDFLKYVKLAHAAYPDSDYVITGHSLGGALAYLASVDLAVNHGINITTAYTFGQPRVGNSIFADTWAQLYLDTSTSYRVTHGLDPVPHVPARISNFQHPATEVYFDGLNTMHKVCDSTGEDPTCADQWLLPVGVSDHVTYLGLDFVAQFLKCNLLLPRRPVDQAHLAAQLKAELSPTPLRHFVALDATTPVAGCEAFRTGCVHGMDLASGVSVAALGVRAGEHVLDLCAAPGNKLCMLADELQQQEDALAGTSAHTAAAASSDAVAAPAPAPATAAAPAAVRGSVTGVDWSYSRLAAARTLVRKYGARSVRFFLADGQTFSAPPPTPAQCHSTAAGHIVDLTHSTHVAATAGGGALASASTFHAASTSDSSSVRLPSSAAAAANASVASPPPVVLRMSKREKRALHKQTARDAWHKKQKLDAANAAAPGEGGVEAAESDATTATSSNEQSAPRLYDRVLVDAECTHDGSNKHTERLSAAVKAAAAPAPTEQPADSSTTVDGTTPVPPAPSDDWRSLHSPERLASLQLLQRNLLHQGFRMLRPGGVLVYSTCSFQREQNEDVVAWLLQQEDSAAAVHVFQGIDSVTIRPADEKQQVADSPAATAIRSPAPTTATESPAACSPLTSHVESAQLHLDRPALRYLRVFRGVDNDLVELGIRMDAVLSGTSGLFVAKIRKKEEGGTHG